VEKLPAQFRPDERIRKGVEFWNTYETGAVQRQPQFGIPPEIIVAIIGVETKYGGNKGNLRVIDSLTSLAFDYPARGSFFRKELRSFLMLAKEQQLDLLQTYGSYAGAMGFPQFMPSSWRNLAIDYSGDGRTDLLNDPVDAIGSVANYFLANGWKTGEEVAVRAQISNDRYDEQLTTDLKTAATLGELATRGLVPREGRPAPETPAWPPSGFKAKTAPNSGLSSRIFSLSPAITVAITMPWPCSSSVRPSAAPGFLQRQKTRNFIFCCNFGTI
jgi:membrane-bound lytic murein transglycosylase B